MSTRALYGNRKRRPPFPPLPAVAATAQAVDLEDLDPGVRGAAAIRACSVCAHPVRGVNLRQVWISLRTSGSDVLPLLVNACSTACADALPEPPEGYARMPHTGGPNVGPQPTRERPR
ncbi:hypothetical protein ACWGHM_00695 [Streptomyces sp. NPDC054904]|uniref:hypothetical protein n=1 Tax=Streptomyces sp. Isolate_45 TaxID=2950111 RepID=UPI002481BBF5|nr:hypothetical protein [Streptomyces sp. Isolate_45]MDA5279197.1 hypothetical protein [Streptomyces sp. Isolate_45]